MYKFSGHDNPFDVYMKPLANDSPMGEWVQFPTTAEKIREVFLRLDIGPSQWAISEVVDHVGGIHATLENCQNLDELNYLAAKLNEMSDRDVEQFAILAVEDLHNDTVAELINLCDNLDCYDFYENISDDEDLGRHWLFNETDMDRRTLRDLEDYIDFEGYGQGVRESEGGFISNDYFVQPNGTTFHEYYMGETGDIPEEAMVTSKLDVPLLDDDERLERAIELAVDMDRFFRVFYPGYEEAHPDFQRQQETICDNLLDGRIAKYDAMLEEVGQGVRDELPLELAEFKAATGYDPEKDKEPEKMTVLVVEPRKAPYVKEIDCGLESLQSEVGGNIEAVYPFDDPVGIVCNEESKLLGMELNRALYGPNGRPYDVIAGPFLVVGLSEDNFASLSEDLIDKFSRRFQTIEVYAQVGGRLVMFQVPQDTLAALDDKTLDAIIQSKVDGKRSVHDKLADAKRESAMKPPTPKIPGRSDHEL